MTTKFVPNPAGWAELNRSQQMVDALHEVAEAIVEHAKTLAPHDTGDYRDGIEADAGIDGEVAVGRVNANDWKSGLLEFGTENEPAHATLRRAAEAEGLTVQK